MSATSRELEILNAAFQRIHAGFEAFPAITSQPDNELSDVLLRLAERLTDNDPYHHPLYCGQMLKPPHPVARLAYSLAMWLNPNNHALDGGRATSRLERECVSDIANMIGWDTHLGHLCGGGTMANFEGLWVARECGDGGAILASQQAHYTHQRLSAVLGVPFHAIPINARGQMDVDQLESILQREHVDTVVVTLGTTAVGAVDPLADVLALRHKYSFRVHVDAAYGGYFTLTNNLEAATCRHFESVTEADSFAIDPHKHGLQPYGCGCILFRDPQVARHYLHDSPYTYYTSEEMHLGEISLECSRAGAAAAALWATMQHLPLEREGEFAKGLESGRRAALGLHAWLTSQELFHPLLQPELDIVVWAVEAASASESSRRARQFFEAAQQEQVYLALATMPRHLVEPLNAITNWDAPTVTCLRSTMMKPEHEEWLPEIIERLERAMATTFAEPD
ncbi:MAG: aspartate aminotransferase family protein [Planctomycetaceae bacterium]|nr:aspartate aminotransferase family protein [Planctomycetaceae bacterium]MCB9953499.1 aspartate aminotransferase family protein [Planctomycetaceae bacterium]